MNRRHIIQAAEAWVKKLLAKDSTGHDWHHIKRVRKMALRIAQEEKVDLFLVELIALLHDLPDHKIVGVDNEKKTLLKIRRWLAGQELPEEMIDEVLYVIENQSYSSSGLRRQKLDSAAGQVVQDADRLEALGAIGIGRCFAFNGKQGNPIHDPAISPRINMSQKLYKKLDATTINHFYEKLLKLKDLMNTRAGKKIATGRHQFMEKFLAEFFAEWEGKN